MADTTVRNTIAIIVGGLAFCFLSVLIGPLLRSNPYDIQIENKVPRELVLEISIMINGMPGDPIQKIELEADTVKQYSLPPEGFARKNHLTYRFTVREASKKADTLTREDAFGVLDVYPADLELAGNGKTLLQISHPNNVQWVSK